MKVHNLKMAESDLIGYMKVDKKYEIINVGEYWHSITIDYHSLIDKIHKKVLKKFNSILKKE